MKVQHGGCLCRGVLFEVHGALKPVLACHCSQCAKTSGNYAAMTSCSSEDPTLSAQDTLRWYQSSPTVQRGFCDRCGSNLFWRQSESADIYITAGTLERPTSLKIAEHIFVASKSDYYEITDGLPHKDEW